MDCLFLFASNKLRNAKSSLATPHPQTSRVLCCLYTWYMLIIKISNKMWYLLSNPDLNGDQYRIWIDFYSLTRQTDYVALNLALLDLKITLVISLTFFAICVDIFFLTNYLKLLTCSISISSVWSTRVWRNWNVCFCIFKFLSQSCVSSKNSSMNLTVQCDVTRAKILFDTIKTSPLNYTYYK